MIRLSENQKIILFGSGENILSALSDRKIVAASVVGVCLDSLMDDTVFPENVREIPFRELKNTEGALIAVVDNQLSDAAVSSFNANGLQYVLFGDIEEQSSVTAEQTAAPECEESPTGSSEEQADLPNGDITPEPEANSVEEDNINCAACNKTFDEQQFAALRSDLNKYFTDISRLIGNTKSKDAALYSSNRELQKFKDNYFVEITEPLALDLIALREDFKKTVEDAVKYNPDKKVLCKNLKVTIDQIDNILVMHDVEEKDGSFYFNGKAFYPPVGDCEKPAAQDPVPEEVSQPEKLVLPALQPEDNTAEALSKFLAESLSRIESILSDDENLVKTISVLRDANKKQLDVCDGFLLTPLFASFIQLEEYMYRRLRELESAESDADAMPIYKDAYVYGKSYIERLLLKFGVHVYSFVSDDFQPKYHRVLRVNKIGADEAEKDKKVAQYCTDCYTLGDKVVYPAKVIVYKL